MSYGTKQRLKRIQRWVELLNSEDDTTSANAERRLIRYGSDAVEPLLKCVNHANNVVRFRSVWLLGLSKDLRAYEAILAACSDPDDGVRYDAVIALAKHSGRRVLPLIWEFFQDGSDVLRGYAAGQAATEIGMYFLRVFPCSDGARQRAGATA